jgi:lipopolysaccharide transport system permease protein
VARDVKVRYTQTVLGAAWAILQPVLTMVVFSLIFGVFARLPSEGYPYPIYVYAAVLPWNFFAAAIGTASGSVVGSAHIVSKVYFPRLIIPMSSIGAPLLDLCIATSILLLMMLWYGVGWTRHLLIAPALVIAITFAALGLGTLLAALTVRYRDFRFVIPFLLQFWMYATPVAYSPQLVPGRWQWLLHLNPMAGLVNASRSIFLGKPFDWLAIAFSLAGATLLFVVGIAYFERVERRFADVI